MSEGIPITYVPARNTIFLAFALAWAEVLDSNDIFLGVNALDYSVSGESQVWVRSRQWIRLMALEDLCKLPESDYETISVDLATLQLAWRRVTGRFRNPSTEKRCFHITLEPVVDSTSRGGSMGHDYSPIDAQALSE